MSLGRAFLTVGSLTMVSRVLGFGRDLMIAALLGSGPAAQAFFVAFRFPNLFRRLFAEGAFNNAFVPLFAKKLEAGDREDARSFAANALSGLSSVLLAFTLAMQLAMPWAIYLLASGFADDPEKMALTVAFSQICFPYMLFMAMTALFSGVLNSLGRFAAAAAAPVFLNLIMILAMALAWALELSIGHALSWGVVIAGVAQVALVWRAAEKVGVRLRLGRPRWTPDVKRLLYLGVPGLIAGGAMQINLVIGTLIASFFDGAVVWLSLADRVYQLPLGLIGVAIGVVLLPRLSKHARAGEEIAAAGAMNRATEFAMLLTLPATAAMLVIPELLISGLFERGAFTAEDSANTAAALRLFALGLPAFVLLKVAPQAWYAQEDTRTPMRFAVLSMALNTLLGVALAPVLGFVAVAIATSVAAWINLLLLVVRLPRLGYLPDRRLITRTGRIALSCVVMSAGVWAMIAGGAATWTPYTLASLLIVVMAGVALYAAAAAATGAIKLAEVAALRRGG